MRLKRVRTTAIGLLAAIVVVTAMTPAQAATRTRHNKVQHHKKVQPWHGWRGDSFYLDGVRYPGGNPHGPATWYNNWEGGFHPEVFWVLLQRQTG